MKLTDILTNGSGDAMRRAWDTSKTAEDFKPIPAGTYTARIASGEITKAKTGTAGYKLTFEIIEGEHTGRLCWHDVWLTPAAMPMAKRDLGKLGIAELEQLEKPFPKGVVCEIKVVLRKDDDGTEHNRVKRFDVIRIDKPEADPFAPKDEPFNPEADL
ncbi:MAG: DUF669 domain-containing protein [Planctomycetota bacterium]